MNPCVAVVALDSGAFVSYCSIHYCILHKGELGLGWTKHLHKE